MYIVHVDCKTAKLVALFNRSTQCGCSLYYSTHTCTCIVVFSGVQYMGDSTLQIVCVQYIQVYMYTLSSVYVSRKVRVQFVNFLDFDPH